VYIVGNSQVIDYEIGPPVLRNSVPYIKIPELAHGVRYTALAHDSDWVLGLASSDGKVVLSTDTHAPDYRWLPELQKNVPTAPPGLYYVDMAIHEGSIMLLRNDGQVIGATVRPRRDWGKPPSAKVPSLPRGWVFTDIWRDPTGFYFGAAKIPAGQKVASAVAKLKGPTRVARGARAVFTAKIATRATVKGQQVVARIDGKVVGKAKADKSGNVRVTINTAKLAKGKHTIKFKTSAKGKSAASKAATATLRIR
jgi:hypothetical protein